LLATADDLQNVPGMSLTAARPLPWLNMLLSAADRAVKDYCKRDFELSAYIDQMDGANQADLVIRQRPVWISQTNLAAPSVGQSLPQATINVVSTQGFHPGTFGNPNAQPPTVGVAIGASSVSSFSYTGTTATSFTGCSGGSGVMQNFPNATAQCSVYSPVVWWDPTASRGQGPNAFGPGTQMVLGQQYMVVDDCQGKGSQAPLPVGVRASNRGLIKRWQGGGGIATGYWFPQNYMGDKLAGTREPYWQQGRGCIKVAYSAGFLTIPDTLKYACLMLVSQMVRIMPNGTDMSSEALGAYNYSALASGDNPEMGSIRRTLARWRESAWSSGN
jgi:hypothetical protein